MKIIKSSKIKYYAAVCLFVFAGAWASAQTLTITGTVSDVQGEPLPGVNIRVQGTTTGTTTDVSGKYSITAPGEQSVLQFSFIGFTQQDVVVGSQRVVNVTLEEDVQQFDEVVVIGYGSVKKSTLTSAVSKMDASALEDRPMARVENALQGQLAGVMVRTVSGEPGQDILIRVRGAASVSANSDPLYVVDGMPLNTLSGVSPTDIESIEVLKDAASSAIYGSRGSNGVVIVTTKKGKQGKARVSLNASYGIQTAEKKLDMLSSEEWMEFRTKANDSKYLNDAAAKGIAASIADDNLTRRANMGLANFNQEYELDPRWFKYLGDDMRSSHPWHTQQGDADAAGLEMLDWQDEFFKPAGITDVSLNVSGGSDNTSYMFSGGIFSQDGLAYGTNFNRYSFRMNIESKINKYFTAGMQFSPSYMTRDNSGRANGKDNRGSHHMLISLPVAEPGTGYYFNTRGNPMYAWQFANSSNKSSPFAYLDNIRHDDMLRMNGNTYLRITPMDGLRIEFSGSANFYNLDGQSYQFTENADSWQKGEGNSSSGGHNTRREWRTLLQALANYDKQFGKHGVSAMLGASREQSDIGYTTDQTFSGGFPNDKINYWFDEGSRTVSNSNVTPLTPGRLASFFGRLIYNFDERYIVSASLRYDGGSMFGADNKWGMFPAFSAGWNISREQFFQDMNLPWLNTLKLRASYGATGNNSIGNSAAYEVFSQSTYAGVPGYYVKVDPAPNPAIGWEKTNSTDIAVDFGLLQNRIQMSVDWYTKTTSDLLYRIPSMGVSGSPVVWGNAGEIFNTGFEVELNTANLTGDFKWNTSFNLSYNVNEARQLGKENTTIYGNYNGVINIMKVGEPLNMFYLPKNIGVWKNQAEIDAYARELGVEKLTANNEAYEIKPGDPRWEDVDRNGDIDFGTGETTDRQIVGNPVPKFTYGMTNRFAWKGFDLSILLTAQTGGMILGQFGRQCDRPGMAVGDNVMGRWRNAWWSESDPGDGETPYIFSGAQGGNTDTRWLYSSNYLRVKNITLGYQIPVTFLSYLRAYVSIENLVKWDSYYGGFSPEAANGSNNTWGLDYAGYPMARMFTFGVNVNF
jgi:TonB-linked SusC/RagA family outer membrane protein